MISLTMYGGYLMPAYSTRYDAALIFAAQAHRQQVRKGTDIPYIAHVVHVSTLLLRYGYHEDVVIAGLLHDVIEDCGIDQATIAAGFGDEVARLVGAVTKPAGLSWEEARTVMLAQVEAGGASVAALKAADALHNIRSILADVERDGEDVWQRFKRGYEPTLRYYQNLLTRVCRWIDMQPLYEELCVAVGELEALSSNVDPLTT